METFIIHQRIELGVENSPMYYSPNMEQGDNGAHRWEITVTRRGKAAELTGSATCFAVRSDGKLGSVKGEIAGNVVSATFDSTFTKAEGQTIAQMVISDADGRQMKLAELCYGVRRTRTGELVTADERVIDLAGMMAMLDEFRAAETAREAAEQARENAEAERREIFAGYQGEIDGVKAEVDFLHPLSITAFSVSPNLVEKGATLSEETFSFAVNRLGAAITLEGQTVSGNSAKRTDTLTADRTYTLKAALNGAEKTATTDIRFVAPVYYGVGSDYALADSTVLSLSRVLTTSRARTFTVNAGDGQYILYALPEALGVPVFKVGGFEGGFALVGAFDFTNASGHTERYRLYRTVNAGLGNTTVAVS